MGENICKCCLHCTVIPLDWIPAHTCLFCTISLYVHFYSFSYFCIFIESVQTWEFEAGSYSAGQNETSSHCGIPGFLWRWSLSHRHTPSLPSSPFHKTFFFSNVIRKEVKLWIFEFKNKQCIAFVQLTASCVLSWNTVAEETCCRGSSNIKPGHSALMMWGLYYLKVSQFYPWFQNIFFFTILFTFFVFFVFCF